MQGALAVDFVLYLHAMKWSGIDIGLLLSGGGIANTLFALTVGTLSDRYGRKPFILTYQILSVITTVIALITANPFYLVPAAILGGLGRGANGAAGGFGPAEMAWIAGYVSPAQRPRVYSTNSAFGFIGMGIGALLASSPALFHLWLPGPLSYRPLFAIGVIVAIAGLLIIVAIPEDRRHQQSDPEPAARTRKQENQLLSKLILTNMLNGLAIGVTGPLISYWFAIRFHIGPSAIAPVMALALFATGLSSVFQGRLAERIGAVRTVVWSRAGGLILLIMLPLMPLYPLAALVYLLRSICNRSTIGLRQALTLSLVQEDRHGLAISLNAVSMQLPQSVGPTIAGYLFEMGQLNLPFFVAAALQGVYVVLYDRIFRPHEPPRPGSERIEPNGVVNDLQ